MSESNTPKIVERIKNRFKKKKVEIEKEDDEGREEWGSPIDFFLSALGYAGTEIFIYI